MFTGTARNRKESDNAFRRAVRNRVVARPKSGVGSGADHG